MHNIWIGALRNISFRFKNLLLKELMFRYPIIGFFSYAFLVLIYHSLSIGLFRASTIIWLIWRSACIRLLFVMHNLLSIQISWVKNIFKIVLFIIFTKLPAKIYITLSKRWTSSSRKKLLPIHRSKFSWIYISCIILAVHRLSF